MDIARFVAVEKTLTTSLVSWSVGSVVAGSALAIAGQRAGNEKLVGFGRQTAAWGAIDGVIAGAGLFSQRRRAPLTEGNVAAKAKGLRRLLLVNALADVGYVAGGLALAGRNRNEKKTLGMGAGDGVAIVIQGIFLLALDVSQARRLA